MRHRAQEQTIKQLILDNGLPLSDFLIGTGDTYSTRKTESRFEFDATDRKEAQEKKAKYAIKYFAAHDLYIVWSCRHPAPYQRYIWRGKYSIDANSVFERCGNTVYKHADVSWGDEEKVLVFSWEQLTNFVSSLDR